MVEKMKLYHPNGQYFGTSKPSTRNINKHISWLKQGNEIHYKDKVYNYKTIHEFQGTIENETRIINIK